MKFASRNVWIVSYLFTAVVWLFLAPPFVQSWTLRPSIRQGFSNFQSKTILYVTESNLLDENYMTVDEIKAELDLRAINYSNCVSRKELVDKLIISRTVGKANPDIIEKFNSIVDNTNTPFITDEMLTEAKSADGNLPGGLSTDLVKALSSDPYIMMMLKDPKMQDMMKAVMTKGPEAIKPYMADPGRLYASLYVYLLYN